MNIMDEHNSNDHPVSVALCYHGQPRALNDTVIEYVKGRNPGVKMDTFAHLWWDGTGEYPNVGLNVSRYSVKAPKNFVEMLYNVLSPRICRLERPGEFSMPANFTRFELAQPSHVMPMMYSIQGALQLPLQSNAMYDWYVKTRLDIQVHSEPIDIDQLDPSYVYTANIHPGGLPDPIMMMIPHRYIHLFAEILESLPMCGECGVEEHIFLSFMRNNNIPYRPLHLAYTVDRTSFRV